MNLTFMDDRLQALSYEIRGAAMEVYNHFGPGLLESLYEKAMIVELESRDIPVLSQVPLEVSYKGRLNHRAQIGFRDTTDTLQTTP